VPIDVTEPGSPGWWFDRLLRRLADRRAHYDRLDAYYDGRVGPPVPAAKSISQAYQRLMRVSRTNFAELVVEAVQERMEVIGFRTGAAGDDLGDQEAMRIWQANSLPADSSLVHTASLSMGMSYVIVGPVDEEIGAPVITPEDPREVIVETDPVRRRKPIAALKVFRDDTAGVDRAYVFVPGQLWRAVRAAPDAGADPFDPASSVPVMDATSWDWESAQLLPFEMVPVVGFPNRPKLNRQVTRGEFEAHLPLLDRINYTVLQRVEIATLQAFRQRALRGGPTHDEHGNEIDYDDIFESDPGAIWHIPETAELWESGQVDLGPVRQAIRDDVQDLAAVTRTPLYYLIPDSSSGSAEGAALAREGLVFKARSRIAEASEAWRQVMSLAFLMAGDEERANRAALEVIWAKPERWSLSERADAAAKAMAGGLSRREALRTVWQFTPTQIEQVEADLAAEALMAQGAEAMATLVTGSGTGTPGEQPVG